MVNIWPIVCVALDAQVCNLHFAVDKIAKGIGGSSLGDNVVSGHVESGFRRVGTDIFCRYAVVTAENKIHWGH